MLLPREKGFKSVAFLGMSKDIGGVDPKVDVKRMFLAFRDVFVKR